VSGTALLPVGVLATSKVRRVVKAPIVGIGGVSSAEDALQYMIAGRRWSGRDGDAARPARTRADRARPRALVRAHGVTRIADVVALSRGSDERARAIPIVALDVRSSGEALRWRGPSATVPLLQGGKRAVHGSRPDVVRRFASELAADVFLDLKFHDIPNTVAGRSAAPRARARASSPCMRRGAGDARGAHGGRRNGRACGVLAVTALTSLDARAWPRMGRTDALEMEEEVLRLAGLRRTRRCTGSSAAAARRPRYAPDLAIGLRCSCPESGWPGAMRTTSDGS
jgi:orotidine-5'-phosphate decarboxylase